MYAQIMKVVGILVVATLVVAALRIHPQPLPPSPPQTASGGYTAILVRQGGSDWQMLNRVPEPWYAYAYTGSNFWLQNFPDPDATKWETGPTPVGQVPVTTSVVINVYKG